MADLPGRTAAYVSTGSLPPRSQTVHIVQDAYDTYRNLDSGALSDVYPALQEVDPALFGISLIGTGGDSLSIGDALIEFPIMSVVKPFIFAVVCSEIGADAAREHIGVNGTGLPFNSLDAIHRQPDGRTNPMVNPGAIAAVSLIPGSSADERWEFILAKLEQFAGRSLLVDEEIYASASATNLRNRDITQALRERDRLFADPDETLDLYTRACSLAVTAHDLAIMGATLADGGNNPVTRQRVVDPEVCHYTLAVMTIAGMYETSGDWLYDTGLPGKSGIGGGVVTIAPGKGGLGTYAPLLDAAGNSVKGQRIAATLAKRLGLGIFLSEPS